MSLGDNRTEEHSKNADAQGVCELFWFERNTKAMNDE